MLESMRDCSRRKDNSYSPADPGYSGNGDSGILSLSYLMVSRVKFPKFPILNFKAGKQNNYRLLAVILFVICFNIAIFTGYPYRVLILFFTCYILLGLVIHVINLGNIETKSQET